QHRYSDVAKIGIQRISADSIKVTIYTYKVGALLGRKGADLEKLKKSLNKIVDKKIDLQVKEIPSHILSAKVIGMQIAQSIEKRTPFKKAVSQVLNRVKKINSVLGIKVSISGRLNGA